MKFRFTLFILILLFFPTLSGQDLSKQLKGTAFEASHIEWENDNPSDIRFQDNKGIAVSDFFREYRKAFNLNQDYEFRAYGKNLKKSSRSDQRYAQYYKGIEVAETQFILHSENGMVTHANGNPVNSLKVDIAPSLSLEQASFYLDKHFNSYVSVHKKSSLSKQIPIRDLKAPKLMISAGSQPRKSENFHLVYRFDIFFPKTLERYDVDIDAHTGALVGQLPRSYDGNILTQGTSLYNGTVDITVMDSDYVTMWDPSSWILTEQDAYGDSGVSWWCADTLVGINGGYRDSWLQALETDPISLIGKSPALTFHQRYAVEAPSDYEGYDGWDGMNVQISTDGGQNWTVLDNPTPEYTNFNLYSFYYNGQGDDNPGWCGSNTDWTLVTIPLDNYSGSTVKIRFVFASDGAYSTADDNSLFGWQIDNIRISTVFDNQGSTDNISTENITTGYVSNTEGKYRLRETTRGKGIATFNGETISTDNAFNESVDYVADDSIFNQEKNRTGVSVHWALEKTYDYYMAKHGRSGYDDNGGLLRAYTGMLFDGSPNNASYIGGGQMLYGDGDGTNFGPIVSLDITAHELTHGVTSATAGLNYINESGALNESFSDIFGKATEFYTRGEVDNWWMGDEIIINALPFRSMSDPNVRFDPDTYLGDYWVETNGESGNDNGGVHTNSGVQNFWYYLLCEGGSGTNDDGVNYSVTAIDMTDAEEIAYRNLTAYLVPSSEFADAAEYSILAAEDLYGEGSQQATSVEEAWQAVGVYMDPYIFVPESVDFDLPAPETPVKQSLEIRNKAIAALEITGMNIEGQGFSFTSVPILPLTIEKVDELELEYDPGTNNDPTSGTLTLTTNDTDHPEVVIALNSAGYDALETHQESGSLKIGTVYPNPFTENLRVEYYLPQPGMVNAFIMNPLGEKVKTILQQNSPSGIRQLEWDGTSDQGDEVPAGNYILILQTENMQVNKMINKL